MLEKNEKPFHSLKKKVEFLNHEVNRKFHVPCGMHVCVHVDYFPCRSEPKLNAVIVAYSINIDCYKSTQQIGLILKFDTPTHCLFEPMLPAILVIAV